MQILERYEGKIKTVGLIVIVSLFLFICITKSVNAADCDPALDLNAYACEWIDATHARVTYNWSDDDQLLDWTGTAGVTMTRGIGTLAITGGSTGFHGIKWNLSGTVGSVTSTVRVDTGTNFRIYSNMAESWAEGTEANPLLGHVWCHAQAGETCPASPSTGFFKVNASNFSNLSPTGTRGTWNTYALSAQTSFLGAYNSINGSDYREIGVFSPTSSLVSLGSSGTVTLATTTLLVEILQTTTSTEEEPPQNEGGYVTDPAMIAGIALIIAGMGFAGGLLFFYRVSREV